MPRQRPVRANAGAVVCLGACLALLLAGCGTDSVSVDAPTLHGADAAACRALVAHLPAHVDDQARRTLEPEGAPAAAWGDPPIVLTCGVARPPGLDRFATCQETNGVGWWIPEDQITGRATDVTMTTVGRAQFVQVHLPADYFPPAAAMVDLAPAIKATIRQVRSCV
ncbi:MAG: DUF3515 domain-containing protein [Nocardioidaceae bacterium]